MTDFNSPDANQSSELSPSEQAISVLTEQGVDREDAVSLLKCEILISDFLKNQSSKGINIELSSLPHLIRTYGQGQHASRGNAASAES